MKTSFPIRKNLRLENYDYSSAGYYFVTICTYNRANFLGFVVGGGLCAAPRIKLTAVGEEVAKSIGSMAGLVKGVTVGQAVIMPNHVHMIVVLSGGHGGPPLHGIIKRFKLYTTKRYNDIQSLKGLLLWQRNYYEHVIRSERSLSEIREYILNNPAKWEEDEYFTLS